MTVSNKKYLNTVFNTTAAMGDKVVSSDATFEIEGFEYLSLLVKQFPWPELSPAGEIEIPMPMGLMRWQPQQLKINQQGPVQIMETKKGHVAKFLEDILIQGAIFNAKVYEGTPENYTRVEPLKSCFMQLDNPDRDWENRSQILLISGTLFYHYLGSEG